MWRDECRSLGWLRLRCAVIERLSPGLARRDMTDRLVQSTGEIFNSLSLAHQKNRFEVTLDDA